MVLRWLAVLPLAAEVTLALDDCLSKPNYFFPGRCRPSQSPGACWKEGGEDVSWACWSASEPKKTDQECQQQGFAGACEYKDYGKNVTDNDLVSCYNVTGFSTQCPGTHWGACYVENGQDWMCIDKGESDISSKRVDCKVTKVPNKTAPYDGTCVFMEVQKIYKCETVPSYGAEPTRCEGENVTFACFSLRLGLPWSCAEDDVRNPSCRTTAVDGQASMTYDGACVYKAVGEEEYDAALDARGLTTVTTTTTLTPTTSTFTTTLTTSTASQTITGSTSTPAPPDETKPSGLSPPGVAGVIAAVAAVVFGALLAWCYCRGPGGDAREAARLRDEVELGHGRQ